MSDIENPLYIGLKEALKRYELTSDQIDLIYSCFICVNAKAKYIPGIRLIKLVYTLTSIIIQKDIGKL